MGCKILKAVNKYTLFTYREYIITLLRTHVYFIEELINQTKSM